MVSVLYRSNRAVLSRCPSFTHTTDSLSPSPSLSNLTIPFFCLAIDPLLFLLVTLTQVWLHLHLTNNKYQIDYDPLLARLGGWRTS